MYLKIEMTICCKHVFNCFIFEFLAQLVFVEIWNLVVWPCWHAAEVGKWSAHRHMWRQKQNICNVNITKWPCRGPKSSHLWRQDSICLSTPATSTVEHSMESWSFWVQKHVCGIKVTLLPNLITWILFSSNEWHLRSRSVSEEGHTQGQMAFVICPCDICIVRIAIQPECWSQ